MITYECNFGLSQNTRTPQLMNAYQFMVYHDEAEEHLGRTPNFKDIKDGYLDGTIDRLRWADTDWMKVILRNAPQTQHSLSVRGGNERVRYFMSGGYLYQEPGYKKTNMNFSTLQLRSNIDAQITKDLTISLDIALRQENRNNSNYGSERLFWETFSTYPYLHDFYPNGLPGPGLAWGNNLVILSRGLSGYLRIKDNFANYKVSFDLKMPWLLEGLYLSGYASHNAQFCSQKKLNDQWDAYRYNPATGDFDNIRPTTGDGNINLIQGYEENRITTLHLRFGYERRFDGHSINTFVACEQSKSTGDWFRAYRRDFLTSSVPYLFAGGDNFKENDGSGTISARQNYFGRFSYGYMDKYMAEFTLRYDGSQNFDAEHRWGLFPGVSAGWRISEENFFRDNVSFIDELKIRGSWGKLGNDRIAAFQYMSTYNMGDGTPIGVAPTSTKGFTVGRLANPKITWETATTKNIGIEAMLFSSKISFDFEYFHSLRTGILAPRQASVPLYTGITLPDQNIGEVSNHGIETGLQFKDKVGDFIFYSGGNLTFARNKIIYFDEAENTPERQKRTGFSMDSYLVYLTDGIYQSADEIAATPHRLNNIPGDIKLLDTNYDNVINDADMVRIYYGNTPQIVYGISMGGSWKGIELNVLWTGQARAKQMISPTATNIHIDYFNGRWISAEETPNSKYPRAFNANSDWTNRADSDFWLKDASFIRLKNVELAYSFPASVLDNIRVSNLRVYISGFNLFSIDKIKVQDPETNNAGGTYYPQQRIYNAGLTLSF
jgi:TonB-linked SusC/RagA family outer membrane protein